MRGHPLLLFCQDGSANLDHATDRYTLRLGVRSVISSLRPSKARAHPLPVRTGLMAQHTCAWRLTAHAPGIRARRPPPDHTRIPAQLGTPSTASVRWRQPHVRQLQPYRHTCRGNPLRLLKTDLLARLLLHKFGTHKECLPVWFAALHRTLVCVLLESHSQRAACVLLTSSCAAHDRCGRLTRRPRCVCNCDHRSSSHGVCRRDVGGGVRGGAQGQGARPFRTDPPAAF